MKKTILYLALVLGFAACKKDEPNPDLCSGTACLNGGFCVDGSCQCPTGFNGANCQFEMLPTSMKATQLEISQFPATDANGVAWDLNDAPDIYLEVINNKTGAAFETGYAENLNGGFVFDINWNILEPSGEYTIKVWDYDFELTANDYIGGVYFTPYNMGQKFPTVLAVNCDGCGLAFNLKGISYQF